MSTKVDPIQALHDAATAPDAPEMPEVVKKRPAAAAAPTTAPDKRMAQLISKVDQQGRELLELRAELAHIRSQKFITEFQFGRVLGVYEATLKTEMLEILRKG
jgi:hypothetical protein